MDRKDLQIMLCFLAVSVLGFSLGLWVSKSYHKSLPAAPVEQVQKTEDQTNDLRCPRGFTCHIVYKDETRLLQEVTK
ncbi:hypothetical protein [Vibrio phage RYC]|nr:hypothetical protein [Vibrio phage RYC]